MPLRSELPSAGAGRVAGEEDLLGKRAGDEGVTGAEVAAGEPAPWRGVETLEVDERRGESRARLRRVEDTCEPDAASLGTMKPKDGIGQ